MDTEDDMEVGLVNQFSCLGTTDKDVLVAQLQKLVGPQLNASAAQFFLDMNNWNLQLAVGAYFDLTDDLNNPNQAGNGISSALAVVGTTTVYSMSLVDDISSVDDSSSVPPLSKFVKMWRIRNSGSQAWPSGSYLRFKSGSKMAVQEKIYLNPPVQASETRDVGAEFLAPEAQGTFSCTFQMCTPDGFCFGDEIWAIITVTSPHDMTLDLSERLQGMAVQAQSLQTCDFDHNNVDEPSATTDNNSMMS